MTTRFYPRIKGLIPLIDRKQAAEPYVVDGKNFVVTSQGPVSALGREIVSYKGIDNPVNIQFFEISETVESFITTDEGIFRLDTETQKLNLVYKFTFRLDSQYPFTKAAVGNKFYFVRQGYPMIEYTIGIQSWQELSGGSIPENIYACEESEGRLVVLTDTWIAWSAIGDGTDFIASAATGAGAQAITKIGFVNSIPIGLRKTPEGFLTFLSTGIIRSQAMQSLIPYRHTILSRDHVPINPFCITSTIDQSIIILTTAGLFKTVGQVPTLWQPIMGQYLKENIIPFLDLVNNQNNPQLFFDFDNSWFVVAVSENQTDYVFTKAYILNITLDEWGSLDTNFVTLVNVKILPSKFLGFSYGLVDIEGSIFVFNNAKGIEYVPPLINGLYYHNIHEEMQGIINNDILRLTVKAKFRTVPTANMPFTDIYNQWGDGVEYLDPENITALEKDAESTVWDWGQVNLLTYSDQFDNAIWTKYFATVIPNAVLAPDGTLTADTIIDNNIAEASFVLQDYLAFDILLYYGVSIHVKKDISSTTAIDFRIVFTGSTLEYGIIRLIPSTGVWTLALATADVIEYGVEDLGTYYRLYIVAKTVDLLNTDIEVKFYPAWGTIASFPVKDITAVGSANIWRAGLTPCPVDQPSIKTEATAKLGECLSATTQGIIEFKTNTIFAAGIINVEVVTESRYYESLNSSITVGPFSMPVEDAHDMYSYINGLILGMSDAAVGEISEDWNSTLQYPAEIVEDWLLLDGEEDWGDSPVGGVKFDLSITPTLDAYTPFADDITTLELVKHEGKNLIYSCYAMGKYHLITIEATQLDDNFHLKTLNANINIGGHML